MKMVLGIGAGLALIGAMIIGAIYGDKMLNSNEQAASSIAATTTSTTVEYAPPSIEEVPDGPMKEAILYGHELVNETNVVAADFVGNQLSCTSCHAGAGYDRDSSSLVGVSAAYPQYIGRSGGIVTLEERINGCMVRSMNGKKFEVDSDEMEAMVAYFGYISEGIPMGADRDWAMKNDMKDVPVPSVEDGEKVYQQSCIACHGADGEGTGANTGPALWGPDSFNDGAGLSRISKMAGYVQNNMPVGAAGTLTDQEAADLAAFILSQDRPEWKNHDRDFPGIKRPSDVMDKEKRQQVKDGTINWPEVVGK